MPGARATHALRVERICTHGAHVFARIARVLARSARVLARSAYVLARRATATRTPGFLEAFRRACTTYEYRQPAPPRQLLPDLLILVRHLFILVRHRPIVGPLARAWQKGHAPGTTMHAPDATEHAARARVRLAGPERGRLATCTLHIMRVQRGEERG